MELMKQEMLKPITVVSQLTRLSCHYPNSGHTIDTLKVVAEDWYEEFKEIPEERFLHLMKIVKRNARFFPVIADIVESDLTEPSVLSINAKVRIKKEAADRRKRTAALNESRRKQHESTIKA